jgi:hypothetical protein
MNKRMQDMNRSMQDMGKRMQDMDKRMGRQHDQVSKQLAQIRNGLGHGFEKFNAAWVKQLLTNLGVADADIKIGYKMPDLQNLVDEGHKEVEFDLFCIEPLLIGEATTFLDKYEMSKMERLVKKKVFIGTSGFSLFNSN